MPSRSIKSPLGKARRRRRRGRNPGTIILFLAVPLYAAANILLSTPCSPGLLDIGKDQADLTRECLSYRAKQIATGEDSSLFDPTSLLYTPLGDLALDMAGVDADSPETKQLIEKYGHLVPANGRITMDDLKRAPADLKAKCDESCKERVKSYLRMHQKDEP